MDENIDMTCSLVDYCRYRPAFSSVSSKLVYCGPGTLSDSLYGVDYLAELVFNQTK